MKVRIDDSTVHLYSLRVFIRSRYRCGDCFSLFTFGFYHNLLENRRNQLHTFLHVNIYRIGADTVYIVEP